MDIKPHPFTLPFAKKEKVAKDTFAFYFDRRQENWEFHPGQYIRMTLPHENVDERGSMHYFTIASSPLDKKYLRVITKVIQSSFKRTLSSLQKGQPVSFFGPNGDFFLQEQENTHVFLAGGIGMTPFISMIEYASAKNLQSNLKLFVAFSTTEEMIFYDRLTKISKQHPNISIVYTLTSPDNSWYGETGRIPPDLIKKYITDVTKPLYYITGPPPMVDAMVKMVGEMGVSEDRILQEHFSGY